MTVRARWSNTSRTHDVATDQKTDQAPTCGFAPENEKPRFTGLSEMGGTGLEPVTPSLSSLVRD